MPALEAEVAAIEALGAPEGDEAEVKAILDATERRIAEIEADPQGLLDGPPDSLRERRSSRARTARSSAAFAEILGPIDSRRPSLCERICFEAEVSRCSRSAGRARALAGCGDDDDETTSTTTTTSGATGATGDSGASGALPADVVTEGNEICAQGNKEFEQIF